jgi:hypothetical protein
MGYKITMGDQQSGAFADFAEFINPSTAEARLDLVYSSPDLPAEVLAKWRNDAEKVWRRNGA